MKIKAWIMKNGNFIFQLLWMLLWATAFMKLNHPIEDPYIHLGILFAWLWVLVFVSDGAFNWGRPYDAKGENDE